MSTATTTTTMRPATAATPTRSRPSLQPAMLRQQTCAGVAAGSCSPSRPAALQARAVGALGERGAHKPPQRAPVRIPPAPWRRKSAVGLCGAAPARPHRRRATRCTGAARALHGPSGPRGVTPRHAALLTRRWWQPRSPGRAPRNRTGAPWVRAAGAGALLCVFFRARLSAFFSLLPNPTCVLVCRSVFFNVLCRFLNSLGSSRRRPGSERKATTRYRRFRRRVCRLTLLQRR